ncbi:hypothetical protein [Peribacillus simplex]|uniref:hypothetical protein n=1 Tax=Peribacillus simplex TaxID=1478 RepID=UPI00162A243E|nr:hypothetical protein [Peribacillus simplex]
MKKALLIIGIMEVIKKNKEFLRKKKSLITLILLIEKAINESISVDFMRDLDVSNEKGLDSRYTGTLEYHQLLSYLIKLPRFKPVHNNYR